MSEDLQKELRKCPFCGGEATLAEQQEVSEVWCVKCGISTGLHPYQGAIRHWNTRPAEDALRAEVERLKEALEHICLVAVFPSPCPDYIEAVRGIAKETLDKSVYASINSDIEKGGEDE